MLDWDHWRALDEAARLVAARAIIDGLRATKPTLSAPRLERFGPPEAVQSIAVVEDTAIDTTFALVPGGVLRPGLDERGLERFWDLQRAWLAALRRKHEHELPYTAKDWSPAQLEARPAVHVGAMLVALRPLDHRALGVEKPRFAQRPLLAHLVYAEDAAARLGYAVPTSDELEWATTAGSRTLFPWGDELPDAIDPRTVPEDAAVWEDESESFADTYMELAPNAIAAWPTSGHFGLQGAGGQPVWCTGPHREELIAGGAARFFPWQGCGEWLWLLSALRVAADTIEQPQGAMLRPVLRLGP